MSFPMEEMEDDVIFEGSPLYQYLRDNQIHDFEATERSKPVTGPGLCFNEPPRTNSGQDEFYVHKLVEQICESELLCEEHYDIVKMHITDRTDDNFKLPVMEVVSVGFTLCSFLLLRSLAYNKLALIFSSIPVIYAVWNRYVEYTCRKNFIKMLVTLKELHVSVRKIYRVHMEYAMVLRGMEISNQDQALHETLNRNTDNIIEKYTHYLSQTIYVLSESCRPLLKYLKGTVPANYINSFEFDIKPSITPQQLYNIFVLKQSEFLLFLTLSLYPKNCDINWEVNTQYILSELVPRVLPTLQYCSEALKRAYAIFKELEFRQKPQQKVQQHWANKDLYISAHNTALRVHVLLNNLWGVVEKLENNHLSSSNADHMQQQLDEILRETEIVNTFIQMTTIKLNQFKQKPPTKILPVPVATTSENQPITIDLMSQDENEPRPYEMYELLVTENEPIEPIEYYGEPELRRILYKRYMSELKTVLQPRKDQTEQQENALSKFPKQDSPHEENSPPEEETPKPAKRNYMIYKEDSDESDEDFIRESAFNPFLQSRPKQFQCEESLSAMGENDENDHQTSFMWK